MRIRKVVVALLASGVATTPLAACRERSNTEPATDAIAPPVDAVATDSSIVESATPDAARDAAVDVSDAAVDAPRYPTSCLDSEAGAPGQGFELAADSVKSFSGTQGYCGWRYGYVTPSAPTAFQEMTVFEPGGPSTPPMHVIFEGGPPPWARIGQRWQHPAVYPNEYWTVRRWVSDVAGRVAISVDTHKVVGNDGNGTIVRIVVDDVTVYVQPHARWDTKTKHFVVDATVKVGSKVDSVLEPFDGNEAWDLTVVEVRVWR